MRTILLFLATICGLQAAHVQVILTNFVGNVSFPSNTTLQLYYTNNPTINGQVIVMGNPVRYPAPYGRTIISNMQPGRVELKVDGYIWSKQQLADIPDDDNLYNWTQLATNATVVTANAPHVLSIKSGDTDTATVTSNAGVYTLTVFGGGGSTGGITSAQSTNIAAYQSLLTSNGLSARLIASNAARIADFGKSITNTQDNVKIGGIGFTNGALFINGASINSESAGDLTINAGTLGAQTITANSLSIGESGDISDVGGTMTFSGNVKGVGATFTRLNAGGVGITNGSIYINGASINSEDAGELTVNASVFSAQGIVANSVGVGDTGSFYNDNGTIKLAGNIVHTGSNYFTAGLNGATISNGTITSNKLAFAISGGSVPAGTVTNNQPTVNFGAVTFGNSGYITNDDGVLTVNGTLFGGAAYFSSATLEGLTVNGQYDAQGATNMSAGFLSSGTIGQARLPANTTNNIGYVQVTNAARPYQMLSTTTTNTAKWQYGWKPFPLPSHTNILSITNGYVQSLTLTGAAQFTLSDNDTNETETIRLEIQGSNQVTWVTANLSNSAVLSLTNGMGVFLFDRRAGTNIWWSYKLR